MLIYKSYPKIGVMKTQIKNKEIFDKVNLLSNQFRFKIVELTQDKEFTITDLSSILELAFTKTSDYVARLEKLGIIEKLKDGKNVKVKSNIKISNNQIVFN